MCQAQPQSQDLVPGNSSWGWLHELMASKESSLLVTEHHLPAASHCQQNVPHPGACRILLILILLLVPTRMPLPQITLHRVFSPFRHGTPPSYTAGGFGSCFAAFFPPLFLADCCTLRAVRVVWVEGRINYSSGQSGKICFPLQNPLPPSPRDPSAPRLLSQESGSIKSSPLALLARQAAPSSDARNAVGGQTAPREQNPGAMGTGGKGRAPLCSICRLGTRAQCSVWVRGGGGIKVTRAVSGLGGWDTLFGHE